ncbi:GNAT family N-acetyltransferase [bacterium]|nr:GNAT family N-acetyltransferase [candidate division CSSED10-310 bacterium]
MKQIPKIEAERLSLRPFNIDDASEVRRLAGDRAIADTTLAIPHPYEDGMAEQWISTHADAFEKDQGVTWAIVRKEDGALVGAISLMGMRKGHQAELGYWIGKPYWNRGYCTEAVRVAVQYAFEELDLIRVHACHLSRNPASGRVMLKVGMEHEGCRRQHVMKWGKAEDLELYGILRQDRENLGDPSGSNK